MAPVPASVAKQAELLRQDGNTYFKKGRFGAAIDAYTEAITLCPDVAVYWTNRAVCHRKRKDWTRLEEDSRKALSLDGSLVKAHFMLGLALVEKKGYADGIKELEKALDLDGGGKSKGLMMDEIWETLAKAKYMEWEVQASERSWRMQTLKEECEKALKEQHLLDVGVNGESESTDLHSKRLEELAEVFERASCSDDQTEVPDYLCCRITLDLLRDPVVTPSGITYERAVLLDHLERVGKFDPVTREALEPHQLAPNLAIKEAVQSFLKEHGWAYKFI